MSRTIEHHTTWDAPAPTVHAVLLDAGYLQARLKELGGHDPALLEHAVDAEQARIRLRQAVPVEFLPSVVRSLTGGDLILVRSETWRPQPQGGFAGDVEVTVQGLPGSISGHQDLVDVDGGSARRVTGQVRVSVPLVGGKIEGVVAEQVTALLQAEDDFTRRWLAGR